MGVSEKRLCRLEARCTIDDTHTMQYSAFSRGGIVPWASFQLTLNFHMARRMYCVWFVSLLLPNNPKSASTPLAQVMEPLLRRLPYPIPSLPSSQLTETQSKSVCMVLLILSTLDIYTNFTIQFITGPFH